MSQGMMTHAPPLADISQLSGAEKVALIVALWTRLDAALAANAELEALTARVAALEAKLNEPAKTPDNSSLPPSHGHKGQQAASPQTGGRAAAPASAGAASRPRAHRRGPGREPVLPARRPWRRAIRSCKRL